MCVRARARVCERGGGRGRTRERERERLVRVEHRKSEPGGLCLCQRMTVQLSGKIEDEWEASEFLFKKMTAEMSGTVKEMLSS